MLQTEFDFILPKGYVDTEGGLHKNGRMRLANAADEIYPQREARVRENPEYLIILILSRVVTSLGTIKTIDEKVIEQLFVSDLNYLQDLYNRINQEEYPVYSCVCPQCKKQVEIPVNFQRADIP